jgi:hypothetical protein
VQRELEGPFAPSALGRPLWRGAGELSWRCHLQIAFSLPSRSTGALCSCAQAVSSTWRLSAASKTRSAASSKLPRPVGSYSTCDVSPSLILRVCGRSLKRMSERVPELSSWWWSGHEARRTASSRSRASVRNSGWSMSQRPSMTPVDELTRDRDRRLLNQSAFPRSFVSCSCERGCLLCAHTGLVSRAEAKQVHHRDPAPPTASA